MKHIPSITTIVFASFLAIGLSQAAQLTLDQELIEAALSSDAQAIQELINAGADVNASSPQTGATSLHYVAKDGSLQAIQTLLGTPSIKVNQKDLQGMTPLHWAVSASRVGILETLLTAPNIDPNIAEQNGITPLYWATYKQNLKMVALLIKAGADVTKRGPNNLSPLDLAAKLRNLQVAQTLINAGATIPTNSQYFSWYLDQAKQVFGKKGNWQGTILKNLGIQNVPRYLHNRELGARPQALQKAKLVISPTVAPNTGTTDLTDLLENLPKRSN